MADVDLTQQSVTITLLPGQKISLYAPTGQHLSGGLSSTKRSAIVTSGGTWVAPTPTPPTPTPIPPSTGVPLGSQPTPSVPLPGYLSPIMDPAFGSKITRISNASGVRQTYSRYAADNADGSRIGLFFSYPGRLLDGHTYADLGSFSQLSGAVWSNVDPNRLWGVDGGGSNILYTQDLTGKVTPFYTFVGFAWIVIGGTKSAWEGGISDDDRYLCITAYTSVGSGSLLVFDTQSKAIVASMPMPSGLDNAQISRDGSSVVVVAGTTRRYSRDLTSAVQLNPYGNHGDNAPGAFVGNNCPGVLSYGTATTTLLAPGTAFEYGHTSGRGPLPVLSNYDTAITKGRAGCDQIVAVHPDGSVTPFAHAHHSPTATSYVSQPQATGLRDGKRVLFASDWGTTSVYAFVAELP